MRHGMAQRPLTAKQVRFVEEYSKDMNATRAALRAGYSEKSKGHGSRFLRDPRIRAAVDARFTERRARHEVTVDKVIQELAAIAFGDVREVMAWGPDGVTLRHSDELSPDAAAMICEVDIGRRGTKLKRTDKLKALELLGKCLGMFTDRVQAEVSGPGGSPLRQDHRILVEFVEGKSGVEPEREKVIEAELV
jgi:phage terminase small subunit